MQEIKCPNCGEIFALDESGYAQIVRQIRDKEFEKALKQREKDFAEKKESELELAGIRQKEEYEKALSEKESFIQQLKAQISGSETEKKLAISEAVNEKEKEREKALEAKNGELAEKARTIEELRAKLQNSETEKKLAVSQALQEKEKELTQRSTEIIELKSKLSNKDTERELKEQALQKEYEDKLKQKGVHPGIWVRLLLNEDDAVKDDWRISYNGCLDPSHPKALDYIRQDVRQICEWGYKLIKHDFSTFDLFGRWGFEMNPFVTHGGWHFHDRSMTSAEVVKALYQAIFDVTKQYDAIIIGCNTIGHLGAGLMHANRTGDDTSGKNWERTRRMGINTLAFRLPQHKTFYDVDADCVGIAGNIPWQLNRQWADVIAESGTPLFVSAKPGLLNDTEKEELRQILVKASAQECHKIPVDWKDTDCPEVWADENGEIVYHWYDVSGSTLESNDERFHITIPLQ